MIDNRFKRLVMKGKIVEDKSYMVVFFHMWRLQDLKEKL